MAFTKTPWWEKLLGTFFLLRLIAALKKYMRQTLPPNDDDWWPKEGEKGGTGTGPSGPKPPASGPLPGEGSSATVPERTRSGKRNFAKKTR